MTDDPTTREAVERVRAYLDNAPHAGPWPLDADLRTVLAALDRVTAERAAATTAERERLRRIVAGMGKNEQWGDSVTVLKSQTYNAALADVTRALDTDTEGA
jgi:hypothetical protein